ncbi:hypothetical protein [Shinella pollutisoli]|uniref:Bacteriophage holin of superfamily 6 (Holin_LLH) n=1 Tax=Shinella pollutisoli TaxID=2250594 RepID=A0ABV7DKG3_9HYPH|nr:hypothetical protein [Shinella pollutisoli]
MSTAMEFLTVLWIVMQPLVTLFIGIVGPVLVTWLAMRLVALLKISDEAKRAEIEGRLREALHASAENAVAYARARFGGSLTAPPIPAALEAAKDYVRSKNAGTLRQLGVSEGDLSDIILSKIGKGAK